MQDSRDTIESIKQNKIIAIVRGVELKNILLMAEALIAGGIMLIEVTFNQSSPTGNKDTCYAIKQLSDHFGDNLLVGAGTVMNTSQVEMSIIAGAKYIISPNTNVDVIKRANQMGAVSIPGAFTPTEIAYAYEAGAHFVKLFPAGTLGLGYIKAVLSPLSHIPLLAVGGVNDTNLMDYLNAGIAGVGVGANIIDTKLIEQGKFDNLTEIAKKYTLQLKK